jgi:hypothetical protein
MALDQNLFRNWIDGDTFSARDYVYERNSIIAYINGLPTVENILAEVAEDYYSKQQLNDGQLDNRYYTETELLTNGILDPRYYTITSINGLLTTERNRLSRLESKFDATILAENDQLFDQAVNTDSAVEFTSVKLGANVVNEAFIDGLENKYTTTQADAKFVAKAQLGEATVGNVIGVATLDGTGRLPVGQLPIDTVVFRGTFGDGVGDLPDGSVNKPVETGDFYICISNGYESVVADPLVFDTGDKAVYDGTNWSKIDNTESVTGVKGDEEVNYRIGNVSLGYADVGAAPLSHTHGNITNAGAIGTTNNQVVVTGTDGVLSTASREGIDSRSTYTPSSHTHGSITNDGKIGTTADQVVVTGADGIVATASRSGIDSRTDFPPSTHTHDDLYYTQTQLNPAAAPNENVLDARYFTETEVNNALALKLNTSLKGAVNGLAELDANGVVPTSQLPSYVDGLDEFANLAAFPTTGIVNRIYVALDTGKTYRWGGTAYAEISPSEVNSVNGYTGVVTLAGSDLAIEANDIDIVATGFTGILDTDDTRLDIALATIDAHTHAYEDITSLPTIYTQSEIDGFLGDKSDTGHTHVEADITDLDKSAGAISYDPSNATIVATNVQAAVDELDALIQQNTSVIKIQRFVITNDNSGADGTFTYTYNGASRNGTIASGQYRFALEDSVEYIIGENRVEVKVNNDINFYVPDGELQEINTTTIGITYGLANNDEVFIKVYQGLDSVALAVADGQITTAKLSQGLQQDLASYTTHINSTNNPHSVTATQVGLSNVTNDAQMKKIASNTNGNVPIWSGTAGDTLADGYGVQTTLSSSTTALVRADAIQSAVNSLSSSIDTKQNTLVSGTNIKTINGSSILGSGNYEIDIPAVSVQATAPNIQTANVGDLWWNTTNAVLYISYDDGDSKQWVEVSYADIQAEINALINGAPGALDTLNELAAAMGDDPNFATTVTNALAGKASTQSVTDLTTTVNTKANKLASFVAVSANRTLELADGANILSCTNTDPITVTVPANATIEFPVGTQIAVLRNGTGTVTFAPASGVTIHSAEDLLDISVQYASAALIKKAENIWQLIGSLG